MYTVESRARRRAWRIKQSFARLNPWTRKTSEMDQSRYNAKTSRRSDLSSSMPGQPIPSGSTSGSPTSDTPSLSNVHQGLVTTHSTIDLSIPHQHSDYVGHERASPVPAAVILQSQQPHHRGPDELHDNVAKASYTFGGDSSNLGHQYTNPILTGGSPRNDTLLCYQQGASDVSRLVPQDDVLDDLTRLINIVVPGHDESTHCAGMLIDSGSENVNLISRKVVDRLGLTPSHGKPSFLKLILNILAPWTESAKMARHQVNDRVRGFDGKEISGQNGIVTLCWYGRNRSELHDPIIWFRPVRYETTHIVVDAEFCCSEVLLSWKEVHRLGLRDLYASPVRKDPTPEPNADEKYAEYEKARAAKAAARQATRDQKNGNGQGQAPIVGSRSAHSTGK